MCLCGGQGDTQVGPKCSDQGCSGFHGESTTWSDGCQFHTQHPHDLPALWWQQPRWVSLEQHTQVFQCTTDQRIKIVDVMAVFVHSIGTTEGVQRLNHHAEVVASAMCNKSGKMLQVTQYMQDNVFASDGHA